MNRRFSKEEKEALIEAATALREKGLSFKAIGKELELSHATVHRWINKEAGAKHLDYNRRYFVEKYKENPEPMRQRSRAYYMPTKRKHMKHIGVITKGQKSNGANTLDATGRKTQKRSRSTLTIIAEKWLPD